MTIPYHIHIGKTLSKAEHKEVELSVAKIFNLVDSKFNRWNPNSEVSKLNQALAHQKIKLSNELLELMSLTDDAYRLTNGYFDPTVETVLSYSRPFFKQGILPNNNQHSELKSLVDWNNISWKSGYFSKSHTEIQLDFGGIAKGYCVDLLVEELKSLGYKNVYVEWGGEVKSFGKHPSGRLWNVMIKDPNKDILIDLDNASIATSGDDNQYYIVRESSDSPPIILSHIFDSMNKQYKEIKHGQINTVSVSCSSCWLADSLATSASLYPSKTAADSWLSNLRYKNEPLHWFHIQINPLPQ